MKGQFDYIVVGAGTAGCVVATRLSQNPGTSVLLVEAGGKTQPLTARIPLLFNPLKEHPRASWRYVSEPEAGAAGRTFARPHGKGLGGSSSINGMIAVRGHPLDYDAWAALGLTGWSHADVLPYFRRAESSWRGESEGHGGHGPWRIGPGNVSDPLFPILVQTARNAGRRVSEDFEDGMQEGLGAPDFSIAAGERVSMATAYLPHAGPGLEILADATVSRILIDNGRATGVEVIRDGQPEQWRARREVILSAGGYNSPKILMLSGIGDAAELKQAGIDPVHHLPGVGKNLQGHVSAPLRYHARIGRGFHSELRFDRLALSALRWAFFRKGTLARVPLAALSYVYSREGLDRPDIQIMYGTGRMDDHPWFPGIRPGIGHFISSSLSLCRPRSRGTVRLRSASPHDDPLIHFNLLDHPDDIVHLRDAMKRERAFYATKPLADLLGPEDLPGTACRSDEELEARIREVCTSGQHPTSACSMGTGPDAVTDERLRVHGIDGLRVADASVMPLMVSGNTYATTVMIGEKAADLISSVVR